MNAERLSERIDEFRKALARLREALSVEENAIIRDAIIQRFEFTYELAWKAMKLWLEFKEVDVRNPKDTLREALQQGLIDNGNGWSLLHEMRNLTSHTYDEKNAKKVVSFVRGEGMELLTALEKRFIGISQ